MTIKYFFFLLGGNCPEGHKLYVITDDDKIYYTEKFDTNTFSFKKNDLEYICDMYSIHNNYLNQYGKVDFEIHQNNIGKGAPICYMFKNDNGKYIHLYTVGMYHNINAVEYVLALTTYHYQLQRIKQLIEELNNAAYAYYNKKPIMSHYEWDKKYDELTTLEYVTGIVFVNSPTQNFGYYDE